MTDADKLLAVLRVVMPGDWKKARGTVSMFYRDKQGIVVASKPLDPTSLDDLRRVLLALTPGQVALFNGWMERLIHDGCGLTEHEVLTAPTSTILTAIHRAVVQHPASRGA